MEVSLLPGSSVSRLGSDLLAFSQQQYYADVLTSDSNVEELTRVFSAASVDYEALPVLTSVFMEVGAIFSLIYPP